MDVDRQSATNVSLQDLVSNFWFVVHFQSCRGLVPDVEGG